MNKAQRHFSARQYEENERKTKYHRSVLTRKILEFLITTDDGIYVDATIGDGGHSLEILKHTKNAKIIGIDKDIQAVETAKKKCKLFGNRISIYYGDFADVEKIVRDDAGYEFIDGILFDLGLRSEMLENSDRGFSFKKEGLLDMRFDRNSSKTAYIVVNRYSEKKLTSIFHDFADLRNARNIAKKIIAARQKKPITTTTELAEIVAKDVPIRRRNDFLAKIFQAIRIEVNDELDKLRKALESSLEILASGGRIAVITYHSGEDRIVKNFFTTETKDCICPPELPVCRCGHRRSLRIITKKPVLPSKEEIEKNIRARSAKLRVAEKL
ncbi:16S rRNA (cytosine(1402)-N(4))-methyltransferase [bacterium]|nr:MAG: 16S rRNA (cytosine(1402)-N(4))-methyltransferase [bacterium]